MKNVLILVGILLISISGYGQRNSEHTPTPPMGWNSWNWHGKHDINEQIVRETIDAIVNEGLKDAGYVYVVVDGGWRDTKLGPNGELLVHPEKFPNGIKPLVDYAHSRGLKFGLHTVPGTHDCAGDPVGGIGHEEVHVQQFIDWGIDFIKLDLCNMEADPCETCEESKRGWSEETILDTYAKWSKLLNESGRDIVFSISAYEYRDWYPQYCNMARTTRDIRSRIHKGGAYFNPKERKNFGHMSVMGVAEMNNLYAEFAGDGYWNDPDMMVTGDQGLSMDEQVSHFALWAIMTSPLFLGNDPRNMTPEEKQLILNREVIAINQDPSEQGYLFLDDNNTQVWLKELSNGSKAVLFLNLDAGRNREVSISLSDLGIKGKVAVRDAITQTDLGKSRNIVSFSLGTNQCRLVIIR